MTGDIRLCPGESEPDQRGIRPDEGLCAQGWVRRHVADATRAQESVDLYESLGFEVMVQNLASEDFGPECRRCALGDCPRFVLVYTRRKDVASTRPRASGDR